MCKELAVTIGKQLASEAFSMQTFVRFISLELWERAIKDHLIHNNVFVPTYPLILWFIFACQISDPDVGPFPSTRAQLKAPGFPGGGAFSDVLTPDLARALLGNEVGRKILPNLPLPIWTLWGTSSFHVKNHQILGFVGGTYKIGSNIKQMEKSEVAFNSCYWPPWHLCLVQPPCRTGCATRPRSISWKLITTPWVFWTFGLNVCQRIWCNKAFVYHEVILNYFHVMTYVNT